MLDELNAQEVDYSLEDDIEELDEDMLDLFDQMKEEDEKLEELEDMFYDFLSENDE